MVKKTKRSHFIFHKWHAFFIVICLVIVAFFITSGVQKQQGSKELFSYHLPPNTTIRSTTGQYAYINDTNTFKTQFKKDPTVPASISFTNTHGNVSFYTPRSQVFGTLNETTPQTQANILTYPNIFKDVNLRYSISPTRLLEEFIIQNVETAIQLSQIKQEAVTNSDYRLNDDGTVTFIRNNKTTFILPKPVLYEVGNNDNKSYGIRYEVSRSLTGVLTISKIITPEGIIWLKDSTRTYPIAIDLVIDNSDTASNWVSSDSTNTTVSQDTVVKHAGTGSVKVQTVAGTYPGDVDLFEYGLDLAARAATTTNTMNATGGNITYSGGYTYHTFTSAGTFTPSVTGPVEVFAWGAGGGGGTVGGWSYGAPGGAGGSANGKLSVTASTAYQVVVGGGGVVHSTVGSAGGGGAASCNGVDNIYGSGGGGYSGIFLTSVAQANSLLIAGGGGGGGSSRAGTGNQGGAGGGGYGERGYSPYDYNKLAYAGNYGTQSGAGANSTSDSANCAGGQGALQGGTAMTNGYGGGGGGGYWGGSGGGYSESNTMAGGGGGSGYFNPGYITFPYLQTGAATTPGDSTNTLRGTYGNAGAVANNGTQGVVIIRYPTVGFSTSGYVSNNTGIKASGGTMTTSTGYIVHTFTRDELLFSPFTSGSSLVNVWGGGGAGGTVGGWSYGAPGGAGGSANGTFTFSSSQYFRVRIGRGGLVHATTAQGAVGGGGPATNNDTDNQYAGGGGGLSGMFLNTVSQANSIIIAGGGGGGGSSRAGTGNAGGGGGGSTAEAGFSPYDGKTAYRGNPGSQVAAGANASSDSANGGGGQGALQGGRTRTNSYGGGGGGGYWGGSAGGYSESNTMAGGGGGSGFLNGSWITSGTLYAGSGTTPGDSANALRGTYGNAGAVAGNGTQGVVIVRYPVPPLEVFSEATIKTEGISSLKGVAIATTSLNSTLTRTIASPLNLSTSESVTFDIRATRTGSNIKVGLHDSGGVTTELTPNITVANTFQSAYMDLTGIAAGNKDVIDQIIITVLNADADNTFYLDNMKNVIPSSYNDTVTITKTATDLSQVPTLNFWVRSTVTGSFARFQLGEITSSEQTFSFSINTANTWEQKSWNISAIPGVSRDAVTKFAFQFTSNTSGATFYFDDLTGSPPNTPTLDLPGDTVINQPLLSVFKTTALDDGGHYLRYKIDLCTNAGMSIGCQTFNQTSSQTGWSGQNTQTSTAYASATQATYTTQSLLATSTTYYWKTSAIDPGESNTWSTTQTTPYSFTTTTTPSTPSNPFAEGVTNPGAVYDLTPEFSAIYSDPDSDVAVQYEIEVNTASDFSGTVMWDAGIVGMSNLSSGSRSTNVSYAGTALAFNSATYYWRIRFTDVNYSVSPWSATQQFTMNIKPAVPSLINPTNLVTGILLLPVYQTTTTDVDSDFLRYKIELCTNPAMTTGCQTFDQTVSQTGWSGQDVQTSTAYSSGATAIYTGQTALMTSTAYYWRSYAIDPGGSNTWTGTQAAPFTFTTTDAPLFSTGCVITETKDDSSLSLRWTDHAIDEEGYEIRRSVDGGPYTMLINTLPVNAASYQDSSITTGHTYSYQIAPFFNAGPTYGVWCTTARLSIERGTFTIKGVKLN